MSHKKTDFRYSRTKFSELGNDYKIIFKIIEQKYKNFRKIKKCSIRHINSGISNKILKFKPKVTIDKGIREILNVQ